MTNNHYSLINVYTPCKQHQISKQDSTQQTALQTYLIIKVQLCWFFTSFMWESGSPSNLLLYKQPFSFSWQGFAFPMNVLKVDVTKKIQLTGWLLFISKEDTIICIGSNATQVKYGYFARFSELPSLALSKRGQLWKLINTGHLLISGTQHTYYTCGSGVVQLQMQQHYMSTHECCRLVGTKFSHHEICDG